MLETANAYNPNILALLPPLMAIIFAMLTRRVLVGLALGIISGAVIFQQFAMLDTLIYLGNTLLSLVWDAGWNTWNLYLIGFLLILGVIAAHITLSGGTTAFSQWAFQRIKTPRGARLFTSMMGLFIFIDDYFNSLAVGNISRPITDSHRISRANLAYIVDSTAAPMCVMTPISSWGGYIITIIGAVLVTHSIQQYTAFSVFMQLIPLNFYVIFALLLVLLTSYFGWTIGSMKQHEHKAQKGELFDKTQGEPMGSTQHITEHPHGHTYDLIIPIAVLIGATIIAFVGLGASALHADNQAFTLISAFEQTDPSKALFYGGLTSLVAIIMLLLPRKIALQDYLHTTKEGLKAMLPAVYILLFAWAITTIIADLQTGSYLASLMDGIISPAFIPLLCFFIAGIMAFCTGTSFGTFGLMLPIAGELSMVADPNLFLAAMAAVLSGAIWGDHSSPISDTTILSSTGAGCHHMDHVMTQLPYSLAAAGVASVGFLALGFSGGNLLIGLSSAAITFIVSLWMMRSWSHKHNAALTLTCNSSS